MRLLIVDDHEVVREGLRAALCADDGIDAVTEAADGRGALQEARRAPPDVALVDFRLPDMPGDELCLQLRERFPSTVIVMLTTYLNEDIVRRSLAAGANAYVTKAAGLAELRRVLKEAVAATPAPGPDGEFEIMRRVHEVVARRGDGLLLTAQQERVLERLSQGLTYAQIGEQLFITESTVRFHVQKLKEKLDVATRTELVAKAIRLALVSPEPEEVPRSTPPH